VLNCKGIPSGDILSLKAALTSEQVEFRRVIEEVNEPGIGDIKLFNLTARFSKTPGVIDSPPPRLSSHTAEILSELGYCTEDIKRLNEMNAI
jgi:crotonobetainyl-CoA:carnitine CoA-transferase CaiB-like acyl-CoA transferase